MMGAPERLSTQPTSSTNDIEKGIPPINAKFNDHPYSRRIGPVNGATAEMDEPSNEVGSPSPSPRTTSPLPSNPSSPFFAPIYPFLSTYSLLVFATMWGVLGRLGLEWIGGFAEREVFAVIWAQIVGCVVMGFVTERKKSIESIFPPLFVMLGTGFCGSMTTWSTMSNDIFVAFANLGQPAGTSRFAGFLSGVAITVITLTASIVALQFGVHIHDFLPSMPSKRRSSSSTSLNRLFNLVTLLIGPLFLLGALFLVIFGPHTWRSRATFAILFGPFGTLLRYEFSRHLNSINPRFPLGTFAANVLSTLIFATIGLLARHPNSSLSCSALKGLQNGFCGSLSTISTFVVELRTLGRKDSWRYFMSSWIASQVMMVVVLGSWVWSDNREGLCWM